MGLSVPPKRPRTREKKKLTIDVGIETEWHHFFLNIEYTFRIREHNDSGTARILRTGKTSGTGNHLKQCLFRMVWRPSTLPSSGNLVGQYTVCR